MTTSSSARLAAAARDSWLIRSVASIVASMRVQPDELPPAVVAADLAVLRRLFEGSVLGSRVLIWARRAVGARLSSRAVDAAGGWRRQIAELTAWQRIRAAGIAGLAATAIDGLLTLIDPRPASVYRWLLWLAAIVVSATLALAADALDTASRDSHVARHQ